MNAQELVPTCGSMPIERKRGPMTMPPPMPRRPAVTPARSAVYGNFLRVSGVHCRSASRYSKPAATRRLWVLSRMIAVTYMKSPRTGTGATYQSHHAQSWQSSASAMIFEMKPCIIVNVVMRKRRPHAQGGNCREYSERIFSTSALSTDAGAVAGAVAWACFSAALTSSRFFCTSLGELRSMNEPYPLTSSSVGARGLPSLPRLTTSTWMPWASAGAGAIASPACVELGGDTFESVAGVASTSRSADDCTAAGEAVACDAAAFAMAFVSFSRIAKPFLIVRTAFQLRMRIRKTMMQIEGSSLLSSTPKTTPRSSPLCMNVLAS
mmetsp:Transcript_2674/g.7358  ORF Transcript_2674/g.7358 Transcript_2674/m.7358 type:complete len:323 (+) Transcript_2674:568-1536(+)